MRTKLTELIFNYEADLMTLDELILSIESIYQPKEDKSLESRKQAFIEEVTPFLQEYGKETLNSFCRYWLERGLRDKKYRFEKQKVFDVKLRLATWVKRAKTYSIVNMLNKGRQVNPLR